MRFIRNMCTMLGKKLCDTELKRARLKWEMKNGAKAGKRDSFSVNRRYPHLSIGMWRFNGRYEELLNTFEDNRRIS